MATGIYRIRNVLTNDPRDCYIGSAAVNISHRWAQHRYCLRSSNHRSIHLQRAWDKYGSENFVFEIVEIVDLIDLSKSEAKIRILEREQYYLDTIQPRYNIEKIAGSHLGRKHTDISKEKMRQAKLGKKQKLEVVEARSEAMKFAYANGLRTATWKGKTFSQTHKDKIRKAGLGRKHTEDSKNLIRESKIGSKNYNSKLTEEQVKEIRILLKDKKLTQKNIANHFKVTRECIKSIKLGKSWRHI